MSEALPLAGAVGALRMLADGSVSVTIIFEPKDRVAVMTLMGQPGAPIACARLADGYAQASDKPATYRDLGPICKEALDLCKSKQFQLWIQCTRQLMADETVARSLILATCNVASRKELDTAEGARDLFIAHVRKPFMAWVRKAQD